MKGFFFVFFILPAAEGAEAEQAPVFRLKQNNKNQCRSVFLCSPEKSPVVRASPKTSVVNKPNSVVNLDPRVNTRADVRFKGLLFGS